MAWPLGTRAWHSVTFTPLCPELDLMVIAVVAQFSKYQNDFLDLLGMRTEFLGSVKLWRLSAACASPHSYLEILEYPECDGWWRPGWDELLSSYATITEQMAQLLLPPQQLPPLPIRLQGCVQVTPPRGPLQLLAFAVIRLIRLKIKVSEVHRLVLQSV